MINVLLETRRSKKNQFNIAYMFVGWKKQKHLIQADISFLNDKHEYKDIRIQGNSEKELVDKLRELCVEYPPKMRITVEIPEKGSEERLMSYFTDSDRYPPGYPKWKFTGTYDYII